MMDQDQDTSELQRQISFSEEIQCFETYSNEEYSREPEEDVELKEEEVEKVIDNLDIHAFDLNMEELFKAVFTDKLQ